MHPLVELRNILAKKASPTKGVVVSISEGIAKVRTSSGISAHTCNVSAAPGNEVYLHNGAVLSVVLPIDDSEIYDV